MELRNALKTTVDIVIVTFGTPYTNQQAGNPPWGVHGVHVVPMAMLLIARSFMNGVIHQPSD